MKEKLTFKDDNSSHCCHQSRKGSCGSFCHSVVSEDIWGPWRPLDPQERVWAQQTAELSQQLTAEEQPNLTPLILLLQGTQSHTPLCITCAKSTDPSMSWFTSWKQKKPFSYISFLLVSQTKLSNRWVRCISELVKMKRRNCIFRQQRHV